MNDGTTDTVYLSDAAFTATVGRDCWHRKNQPQPVLISIRLHTSIKLAGEKDDVFETIHYGHVYKAIASEMGKSHYYPNLETLAEKICLIGLEIGKGKHAQTTVSLPKGHLQAHGVGFTSTMTRPDNDGGKSKAAENNKEPSVLFVENLQLPCIIGVNDHERKDKQLVRVNLKFHGVAEKDLQSDYQAMLMPIVRVRTYISSHSIKLPRPPFMYLLPHPLVCILCARDLTNTSNLPCSHLFSTSKHPPI